MVNPTAALRQQAFRCAQASWLAYLEADALAEASAATGFTLREALTRGCHAAIVLDRDDTRIVAFRGTNEAADWWTNLNILFRRTAWGVAHRGFCDAAGLFWPDVDQQVQSAAGEGRRLWFSGHSLGGAMATVAAAKLLTTNEQAVEGLCTFGQPPVGGGKFRRNCDRVLGARYVRIVNHTDSVVGGGFFSHAGTLWYFDTGGQLHYGSKPFVQGVRDEWKANRMLGGLYMFGAHGMKQYLPLLDPGGTRRVTCTAVVGAAFRRPNSRSCGPLERFPLVRSTRSWYFSGGRCHGRVLTGPSEARVTGVG